MKTLFVSDLDGTLLTKEERVSDYSRELLNRLIGAGMTFTYATARSACSAARAVEGLAVHAPVILYNGGLIYDYHAKKVLRCMYFEEDWKYYVFSALRRFGINPFVFGACRDREWVKWMTGGESFGMRRYISRREGDIRLQPVYSERDLLDGYIFYFKCIGPKDQLERAWNDLKFDDRFICIFHQEMYQSDFWMEISPRAATKANAVTFLKEYLGCSRAICFGDTSNDSDMFDVCEEKYAVMNADEWLKKKASGIVGYCEEDGVAKWLAQNSGF